MGVGRQGVSDTREEGQRAGEWPWPHVEKTSCPGAGILTTSDKQGRWGKALSRMDRSCWLSLGQPFCSLGLSFLICTCH